jgi:hypothetical protein
VAARRANRAFALSSGLLGLRMLTTGRARLQGVLLSGGLVAALAWGAGWYLAESSARISAQETASLIQTLGFGALVVCWLAVALLELRGDTAPAVEPVHAA